MRVFVGLAFAAALGMAQTAVAQEKPARLQPTRIHSIGDSITRAFDSNLIFDNPSESWVNGYTNEILQIFGLEDVNSHFQRAYAAFGVNRNVNGAVNGADMFDMAGQATQALTTTPYYVTVELGGNDVCQDSVQEIPQPLDYAFAFLDGVFALDPSVVDVEGGLTPGATVYVASVPDVKQLYDVAKDETGLFGVDCELIWLTTLVGFPCGSMLGPLASEEQRLAVQQVNLAYNFVLSILVDAVNDLSSNVYWEFTWSLWNLEMVGEQISSIDCFHPSSEGQRVASELTWADGPFSAF